MTFEVTQLKKWVGARVDVAVEELLTQPTATELRRLLVERGVLLFRGLKLSESEQRHLSELLGTLRQEGDQGVPQGRGRAG